MSRPAPTISLPARTAHALAIALFILLAATGLRIAVVNGAEWLSPEVRALIDRLTPTGNIYRLHLFAGVLLAATGIFYCAYLLFTGEHRRLTDLFHRSEYSFTRKLTYLSMLVLAAAALLTGTSLAAGLYSGGPGYLFNSFVHQWSFRLLVLFAALHTLEVSLSLRGRVACMFSGKPLVGAVRWPALAIAAAVAVAGGTALHVSLGRPPTLACRAAGSPIVIDGYLGEGEWAGADSAIVQTQGGANFLYAAAPVTVKTARDRQRIFFLLRWPDDTRSLNRHLVKTDTGWIPERSVFTGPYGEDIFFEDQAALYFSRSGGCASTCHVGRASRPGRHFTGGDTADVWVWMAVSTNPTAEADDRYWAAPAGESGDGRFFDNLAAGGYRDNLDSILRFPYFVPTHRLFRDWLLYGTPGYEAYDHRADTFPLGHRIPAVLVAPSTGDRGDIEARGVWREGVWTVELSRLLATGSPTDIGFQSELYLGIAVFDNAEKKHAGHLRPLRLVME
ncbi:MAG TPA: ethylbenzene dehydrogenase-related protein [candidate division Zixibacteria bacterium]|nr:cytochrome b/b6 domain-containing protein [candidate division Zixibacteria bacterium]MDD4918821.1 ethylbenzene dehydrogenase-related protein [candidate division Zixibacteria bacterium]MDM7973626.1 ethylbenzene dehydrogenase-related protein [candidate division Zixibacteria bacterium]HOZ06964.1 ethylbenzene dehydrogenase-related protein [candidate division Zixibacteria bacterium]HPI32530.1 ethylbenzene dehydrogenase-related protein [candidate division Zixibacteria bacterium]